MGPRGAPRSPPGRDREAWRLGVWPRRPAAACAHGPRRRCASGARVDDSGQRSGQRPGQGTKGGANPWRGGAPRGQSVPGTFRLSGPNAIGPAGMCPVSEPAGSSVNHLQNGRSGYLGSPTDCPTPRPAVTNTHHAPTGCPGRMGKAPGRSSRFPVFSRVFVAPGVPHLAGGAHRAQGA